MNYFKYPHKSFNTLMFVASLFSSADLHSQQAPEDKWKPVAHVQREDYVAARRRFATKLGKRTGSPQPVEASDSVDVLPAGVTQIFFPSGDLTLKAWMNKPAAEGDKKYPAVVFLHGGYSFGKGDWDMTKPFRDSGFVVIAPMLRGENGQPGIFTLYYDEVNDAIAAGEYARHQSFIDSGRIYLAGHSVGAIITLLAAEAANNFRKAASFSGSPDQVLAYKYVIDPKLIPFDTVDVTELQMRSPLAYAGSFKCPVRIWYGTKEPHLRLTSQQMAAVAKEKGLDVESEEVPGGHMSAVPAEAILAIRFFNQQ